LTNPDETSTETNTNQTPITIGNLNTNPLGSGQTSSFGGSGDGSLGGGDPDSNGNNNGNTSNCSSQPFDFPLPGEQLIVVHYNQSLVASNEVNCVRNEFFNRFPGIKLAPFTSDNPFVDVWIIPANACSLFPCSSAGNSSAKNTVRKAVEEDDRTSPN